MNADAALGSEHRLVGANAKQYAQSLEDEMQRRGLAFVPIVWP
jgi:catechol-2,3-dioxygenase